jgi:serine phosphatase RsbU (regulator of sigma subunit)
MRESIDDAVEESRARAVAATGLPGMDPSERYDKITRAAREVFDVPLALVNLVDDQAIETISPQPDAGRWVTPFGAAFCEYTVRQDDILMVPDTAEDERFRDRPAVVANGIRFYAGIPLHVEEGTAVGTLCLLDTSPRAMTAEEQERLRSFADWAQHAVQGSAERSTRHAARARATVASEHRGDLAIHTLDMPWGDASGDFHTHAAEDALVNASLGDVMGKGERAERLGTLIASGLHRVDASPGATLAAAQAIAHERLSSEDAFATLVHLVVDPDSDRVRFVDAGHGLSVHIARDGAVTRLFSSDLPFGLQEVGEEWHEHEIGLAPGEALLSVSDGVLDLYDGTLAGLDALTEDYRASADAVAFFERVQERVAENPPIDDVTVLVVARVTG